MKLLHVLARASALAACTAALVAPVSQASAQATWPSKPIKILVGSPPGGPSDITSRLFADHLQRRLGQPVVVENRPGAGNGIAAGAVATSEPDGYTLVLSPDTVLTVNPHVYGNQNFDARTDLANVSVLSTFSQMLVCNPATGVKTVADLVAKAKAAPLTYASGGPGVPGHLAAEMFLEATGAKMQHVPYRGPAPATRAVLAGEVNCGFLATPTLIPHVQAGKLDALAVSSASGSALAPSVPTLAKALKQPDLDVTFRLVLQAQAKTPPAIIAALEAAAADIMKQPEVQARLRASDLAAVGSSSAQAQQVLRAEMARWEPLVKRLDLKPN